ncbi:hypothetical protein WMY93_022335 [Mugilogobius chulae]|uniref:Uncharacterized protein n=1 Tax=Mugilogobius chulae TaxID=88201 RepID=A0AAW0N895_9GOBI
MQDASLSHMIESILKKNQEHFYSAEGGGTGFLAWRLKFVQKEASDGQKKRARHLHRKGSKG